MAKKLKKSEVTFTLLGVGMKPLSPAQISARLSELARTLDRDFHGLSIEFAIERLISRLIQVRST